MIDYRTGSWCDRVSQEGVIVKDYRGGSWCDRL